MTMQRNIVITYSDRHQTILFFCFSNFIFRVKPAFIALFVMMETLCTSHFPTGGIFEVRNDDVRTLEFGMRINETEISFQEGGE